MIDALCDRAISDAYIEFAHEDNANTVEKIAQAYGISTRGISNHTGIGGKIKRVLNAKGPVLCNVTLQSGAQIYPKLLSGRPIEDSHPLLSRDEFRKNMLVKAIT